jgi:transposase
MFEVPEGYYLIKKEDYDNLVRDYTKLLKRVSELEARSNKNSQNSSKPPSSDGLKRVIKNNREPTKRNPGGQPDHPGHNLKMVAQADKVIRVNLEGYCSCGEDLTQTPLSHIQRRQVFDIPVKLFEVTEYQVEIKKCKCGKVHEAPCEVNNHVQYGSRFKSLMVYLNQYQFLPFDRLQEFCKDCFGISISDGFLEQNNKNCYENLAQIEATIKAALLNSSVIHNDETGIRCQGKTQWIHNTSTPHHTLYNIHQKRGIEAMNEIGILNQYKGISVHDRWSSYDQYNCTHSLCNAHLLRDLKFLNEEMQCDWAGQMKAWLVKVNNYKNEGILNEMLIETIETQYCEIVQQGFAELPKEPVPEKTKRGRKSKSKSALLLDVFLDRSQDVLMFLYNPEVPFDNNLAERDLRMIKLKQKISGCFRSLNGAEVFCRIRSYISTVRKQGYGVLDAIQLAINNKPVIVFRGEQ